MSGTILDRQCQPLLVLPCVRWLLSLSPAPSGSYGWLTSMAFWTVVHSSIPSVLQLISCRTCTVHPSPHPLRSHLTLATLHNHASHFTHTSSALTLHSHTSHSWMARPRCMRLGAPLSWRCCWLRCVYVCGRGLPVCPRQGATRRCCSHKGAHGVQGWGSA